MFNYIFFVIICICLNSFKLSQCCSYATRDGLLMLRCTQMKLEAFPKYIDNSTEFLRLEKNEIKDIPQNFSYMLPKLVKADISRNKITTLEANVFSNFKKLKSVYLQDNHISVVKNDILKGLESTEIYLRLSNNNISIIHQNAFSGLYADTYLDLNLNSISFLHPETFIDVRGLLNLNLADNQLTVLPDQLLKNQENLFTINLRNNKISSLSKNIFEGLHALQFIDLSFNKLTFLSSSLFAKNNKLQKIYLESNLLTHIPFNLPPSVIEVKLKGNPIVCDCELKVMLQDSFLKSKLKDFDDIFCQNYANHTTKEVLEELVCEVPTTAATSSLYNIRANKTTTSPEEKSLDTDNDLSWRTMLAIILSVVVLLVVVVLFIILYRKCIVKTGHQAYNFVEISTMSLARKSSKKSQAHLIPSTLNSYDIEQQKMEGWDGTSAAVYRKIEGVI